MQEMIFLLNTLNGREKAVIVWLLIFLFWALFQKNIRTSMLNVLKSVYIYFSYLFVFLQNTSMGHLAD